MKTVSRDWCGQQMKYNQYSRWVGKLGPGRPVGSIASLQRDPRVVPSPPRVWLSPSVRSDNNR